MLKEYVSDLAAQIGMKLSNIKLIEGEAVGCLDSHTLMMSSNGCNVSMIIYRKDLEALEQGNECVCMEASIREKLLRLQMLIES